MKIAGRKNDGAWFRANKVIKQLNNDEKAALQDLFTLEEKVTQVFQVIQDMAIDAGMIVGQTVNLPEDSEQMLQFWTQNGIPRQVWFGQLSFDSYTKTGTGDDAVYKPDHQSIMFDAGVAVRKIMKKFVFSRRQALDLGNFAPRGAGNPGGIANATEGD